MSSSQSPHRSPEQEERPKPHKIFVTGLSVELPPAKMQEILEEKFARYGKLDSVVVKKSFNSQYAFAFVEYKEGEDATEAVNELNNTSVEGKKMKVELQDNARRRKGGNQACFNCGKTGHYARNCRQARERQASKSDSESRHRHKKHKKKHHRRSYSSDDSDSHRRRKSEKKKKSKKVKKHSKSKKSHRHSDSDSSA